MTTLSPGRPAAAALLAALLAAPALAADLHVPHERYQLDNGLDVVLAPDASTPVVHVQVWYHVGSKDERAGRTGFAHLFEHLMFQGSKNAPGEFFTPIQEVGGNLNGTTNTDRTNYFETVPAHHLPLALFLEADRMGALLDVLDQSKLDNQREVVRNERRQRYEVPPYGEVWVWLSEALYPKGHPYHHPTIGSHADLQAASLDDVKDFFRTWYVPNNATLVITGDFEPERARHLVAEQFGWIPRGPEPTVTTAAPVVLPADVRIVKEDDVPDQKVWLAWHSPVAFAPGDAELDVAASLLCDGSDSRLVRKLVDELRIARDVSCSQVSRQLGSMLIVNATASKGHSTDEIVTVIDAELSALVGSSAPTADEVEAARASYESAFYARIATIQGRADAMSGYLLSLGTPDGLATDLGRYEKLGPDDVRRTVASVLTAPRVELHVVPQPAAPTTPGTTP